MKFVWVTVRFLRRYISNVSQIGQKKKLKQVPSPPALRSQHAATLPLLPSATLACTAQRSSHFLSELQLHIASCFGVSSEENRIILLLNIWAYAASVHVTVHFKQSDLHTLMSLRVSLRSKDATNVPKRTTTEVYAVDVTKTYN